MTSELTFKKVKVLEYEFADVQNLAEASLAQIWLSMEEDVWNQYLKARRN